MIGVVTVYIGYIHLIQLIQMNGCSVIPPHRDLIQFFKIFKKFLKNFPFPPSKPLTNPPPYAIMYLQSTTTTNQLRKASVASWSPSPVSTIAMRRPLKIKPLGHVGEGGFRTKHNRWAALETVTTNTQLAR